MISFCVILNKYKEFNMKKIIILNCGPRKDFNTAQMLKSTAKGAESVGAEVEYFDLYDFNFKGCVSCLNCKRKGAVTNGLCAFRDEITPLLEKCLNADAIIFGSPIYLAYPTGEFKCFIERLIFPCITYLKDENTGFLKRVLDKNIPIGIVYTMNLPEDMAKVSNYPAVMNTIQSFFELAFGYCESLFAYDTAQFNDYSKYDCELFDPNHKMEMKEKQFPKDLEKAFDMGKRLAIM